MRYGELNAVFMEQFLQTVETSVELVRARFEWNRSGGPRGDGLPRLNGQRNSNMQRIGES